MKLVAALLEVDPLWSRATAEALLLGMPASLAEGERSLADDSITSAGPYLELGLWDDAAKILQRDESDEGFSPALRLSHLLYAQHMLDDKAAVEATLEQMRAAPVELAHPWSAASLIVMSELAAAFPKEAIVQHLLGNILASRKRVVDAKAAWKKALDLGLAHSVVYRNLAVAEAHLEQNEAAVGYYRKAWDLSKGSLNLFSEMDRFLAGQGLHEERDRIYQQLPAGARAHSLVALRRIPQLLDLER